jgi:hypothetical protein
MVWIGSVYAGFARIPLQAGNIRQIKRFEFLPLRPIPQFKALSCLVCVLNRLIFCFSVGFSSVPKRFLFA